jgi:hypothetical protein
MAFNLPQRTSIGAQTPTSPAVWVRPADWISITGVSTGQILFLVSDGINLNNTTYNLDITKTGIGNVYIDWGDGTSTTVSANSVQSHTYTSGGTACSLGYNTWKITITKDVAVRVTGAKFVYSSDYSGTPYPLLEAWYGDTTLTSAAFYFAAGTAILPFLQYVKLPEGMTDTLSLHRTFQTNTAIKKIDLPTSLAGCTSMDGFATSASALIEISTLPQDMTGLTTLFQAFDGCSSIQKIVCPPILNSLTTINRFVQNCFALTTLVLPTSMTACADYGLAFTSCSSLLSIAVPQLKPSTTIAIAFNNCTNLRNVTFPNNTPSTITLDLSSAFNGCSNIQSIILPPNVKVSNYLNAFLNCFSLKTLSLPMDGSAITSMATMCSNCNSLTNITLPTTAPSAAISMASIFLNCTSLSTITIPLTYQITDLSSAFSGCRSIKSVTIPNNTQNSLTTLSQSFLNCNKLESAVLPTAMTGVTTTASMFQNCNSLTAATFPASMPALTTMTSMFSNCFSLQTVTLPTTISGNNVAALGTMFNNCYRIKSITLPATITSNTIPSALGTTFANCYSVKSITLPSSNLTSINSAVSTFNGCRSLTGVTNMASFGSSASGGTIVTSTTLATDTRNLLSLTLSCRLTKLEVNGTSGTGNQSNMTSLRLSNVGTGQWGGTSPQIDVSYTSLSTAALNLLFADMAAQGTVTSKTINITSATGAAGLTAGDRLVITSKGWTITG